MHDIDSRIANALLPAEFKILRTCELFISDFSDEAYHFRPIHSERFGDFSPASYFFTPLQLRHIMCPSVDDVHEAETVNCIELSIVNHSQFLVVSEIAFIFVDYPLSVQKIPEHLVV